MRELRKSPILLFEVDIDKKKTPESISRRIPSEAKNHIQSISVVDNRVVVEINLEEAIRKHYTTVNGGTSSKHCIDEDYLIFEGVVGSVLSGVYNAIGEQVIYKGAFSLENMLGYTLMVNQSERQMKNPHATFATNKYTMRYEFNGMTEDRVEREWEKFINCLFKMLST